MLWHKITIRRIIISRGKYIANNNANYYYIELTRILYYYRIRVIPYTRYTIVIEYKIEYYNINILNAIV